MKPLSKSFYGHPTLDTARRLLGKILVREIEDRVVAGWIVETEAYLGPGDPASHAHRGPTPRSRIMFGPPGRAYIYFCYGNHCLLNVVTDKDGRAGAVLLRSVRLLPAGLEKTASIREGILVKGPGRLTRKFSLDLSWNGWDLTRGEKLYIREGIRVRNKDIESGPRVGISQGTDRPWRFTLVPGFKTPR